MQSVLLTVVALIPLFILPGFSFYFDVVPRLWFLMFATAAGFVFRPTAVRRIGELYASPRGRTFCWLLGAQAASIVLSTALSTRPLLSLEGSNWRRFGAIPQLSILLLTTLLAADLLRGSGAVRKFLTATVMAGSIAAAYGILQYFGIDPLQDSARYHVGEGVWAIVRPPATLGHADYFGVYLLLVLFAGIAIVRVDRAIALTSITLSSIALVLSGTRGAMLGALVGLLVLWSVRRPKLSRTHAFAAAGILLAFTAFYLSPPGTPLRARVHWASEDSRGGARLELFRDTFGMAAQRPLAGYGPETFGLEFPRFQSVALAKKYPDFYHESPHNFLLDAFAAQGLIAPLLWVAIVAFTSRIALALAKAGNREGAVLLGGLAALLSSQMFVAFTIATAVCVYCVLAAIVALDLPDPQPLKSRTSLATVPLAFLLIGYAAKTALVDHKLAELRDRLAAMDVTGAIHAYESTQGAGVDLFYARSMARIAGTATSPLLAVQAAQQAIIGGESALRSSDEPANAAYFLASQYAARNQMNETERSLRIASGFAPNWFKPHWMLARVLALQNRFQEARAEAALAAERSSAPEVAQTLREVTTRVQEP